MNEDYNEYVHNNKENYLRRNILELSMQMKQDVFNDINSHEILEKIQIALFDLSKEMTGCSHSITNVLLSRVLDDIDKRRHNKNPVHGIPSGFSILDFLTRGFRVSGFSVIYGNYKIQYIAWDMLAHITLNQRIPTAYFSLGTSDIVIMEELLIKDSGVDCKYCRTGLFTSKDYLALIKSAERMDGMPLYIVDKPEMSIFDIYVKAVELKISGKIEIIFIDNFHFIHSNERASVSKVIKRLARELAIPIVLLYGNDRSILNADVWQNIRQDADTIIRLKRWNAGKLRLVLEKNRYGQITEMEFDWPPKK